MSIIAIKLIRAYQYFSKTLLRHNAIPFLFPTVCRFYPTCSDYTAESISEFGFWKGSFKGFIRILKCNPMSNPKLGS